MSYKVLAKTGRYMQGHYEFGPFEAKEERAAFVQRPDVWWYFYPEADEDFFFGNDGSASWTAPKGNGGGWRKGGAWAVQQQEIGLERLKHPEPEPDQDPEDRW
jgi:hypothetical protein